MKILLKSVYSQIKGAFLEHDFNKIIHSNKKKRPEGESEH